MIRVDLTSVRIMFTGQILMKGHTITRIPIPSLLRMSSTVSGIEGSRFMQKLINKKGAKTKKQWYKPHLGEPLEVQSNKRKNGISHGHSIRLRQHGHVLYDKITEIINSGEMSQDILEKQVGITSVKIHKDMNNLNVYWDADRDDWEAVEHLLHEYSGKLRSLLISYHVLGRIPHIVFVKDAAKVNLSHLFDKADYGPDYLPGQIQTDTVEVDQVPQTPSTFQDSNLFTRSWEVGGDGSAAQCAKSENDDYRDNHHKSLVDLFEKNLSMRNEQFVQANEEFERSVDERSSSSDCASNELHFRSDLYGLSREELVKKILAKKRKPVFSETIEHSPPVDFHVNSADAFASIKSTVFTKTKLRQRLAKEERRLKEVMLTRDSSDF